MIATLPQKKCAPKGKADRLSPAAAEALLQELGSGWAVSPADRLEKVFRFKDFRGAMDFADRVGKIAEAENHHPEITIGWGRARVTLWTHSAEGLSENDFILAAKIEAMPGLAA